jgi:glycosyltransferase involved in cell wall biosynthesis
MNRRIAMISEHASPLAVLGGVDAGGQNVYVAHMARRLAALGDRVDVFTRRDDLELPDVVELAPGVRVMNVAAGPAEPIPKEGLLPHMAAFRDSMLRDWARNGRRYDVIHANFFMSGLVAAEIKRILGIPFVITFHALGRVRRQFQGPDDGFPAERSSIEERVAAEADRIIAECPQDAQDLVALYAADRGRISIVPCGFDPTEFSPRNALLARRELGLDPAERILLQLGRIVPRKGIDTVIQAVGRLMRDHRMPVRLLIVGGSERDPSPARDPELGRLVELSKAEGVADRVTFVGRRDRDEIASYYTAADLFISTPWYEPFGITPLEAMACGTPVIGSKVGGIKFSVRHGETGYLVPPRDPDALAARIAELYANPKLLAEFGRKAIGRVNDLFTWARVAGALSAVYDEVLAGRRMERRVAPERRRAVRPPVEVAAR